MDTDGEIKGFFGEYRWLSNFWPVDILYKDILFPSTEHAYVYEKRATEWNPGALAYLLNQSSQGAKRIGRTIQLRGDFDTEKLDIMLTINRIKFQNKQLAQKLIDTGDTYLEELNNWGDTFWGVSHNGVGLNNLGKILMKIRAEIR